MTYIGRTLFDKIWDEHVVTTIDNGPDVLFIDRHLIHEVTSPQAFDGLERRGVPVYDPARVFAVADHNVPTVDQHLPVKNEDSRIQIQKLEENCRRYNIKYSGLGDPEQGIVHIACPEAGITLPGNTIVCGDSHTSTHGAFGAVAFGIGTSEVETVLATQCLLQYKPKRMRINISGAPGKGVSAKDIILYIISQLSSGGCTGYFIEYAGPVIKDLSMEERMTICNMSIEMGARGGMIAPDEKTFNYIRDRKYAPQGEAYSIAERYWRTLFSDNDAVFDREHDLDISGAEPVITYGTNPGMAIKISGRIPHVNEITGEGRQSFLKALDYMGFEPGYSLIGHRVNYIFIGSCTNGRIEDLRIVANIIKGRKKADNVTAYIVPGSKKVEEQAVNEGIKDILEEAGFELRQPGCSACLAMNDDRIPSGEYCVSTANRNFEGRQGPGARTLLASPATAAACAVAGCVVDVREYL